MSCYSHRQLLERLDRYKIIQGPLAGVSNVVFRDLIWRYSQPAWVYSEMISCKTILSGTEHVKRRYLQVSPNEGALCMQIATSDPFECAKACRVLDDLNISMIDLNVGCPVKKIRKKGQGSFLLSQPKLLKEIIMAMKENTAKPVSVKIRVDGSTNQSYNELVIDAVNGAGADFLVVHGRSYLEGYDVECNLSQIKFFTKYANMPIIGNGDVFDFDSAKDMLAVGCKGVMVSRASVGAPYLISQMQAKMGVLPSSTVLDFKASWNVFVSHIQELASFLGGEKFALFQARGLVKYYVKRNGFAKELIQVVRDVESIEDILKISIDSYC